MSLGSILTFCIIHKFKRKSLLVTGMFLMSISNGITSYLMFTEQVILSVILMNICVAISSIFIENTFWIYLREVLTD